MTEAINIIATVVGKPGSAEAIKQVITPCVQESRKEAGCLAYTAYQQQSRSDCFVFIERWKGQESIDLHVQTAHFQALVEGLGPHLAEPLDVAMLTEV